MSENQNPVSIDGVLVQWGSYLFGEAKKPRQAKRVQLPRISTTGKGGSGRAQGAASVRAKLALTARRAPEVMVKISGSAKTIAQVKNHLDYISRNGQVPIETEDGDLLSGRDQVRELRDEWHTTGHYPIPESSAYRETINIVLSMPAGTDRLAVTRAARDFATEHFADNHHYVFAVHDDQAHPHIHLVVKARGYDGRRLNPRKGDLRQWRETFAEKLRDHGITANATPRFVRGVARPGVPQTAIHIPKEGRAVRTVYDPNRPAPAPIVARQQARDANVVNAYGHMSKALARSADVADRDQAMATLQFVKETPVLMQLVRKPTVAPAIKPERPPPSVVIGPKMRR